MPQVAINSPRSYDEVMERVTALRHLHSMNSVSRQRIRAIMLGGRESIIALLGADTKLKDIDLPTVNLMHSGMTRLAQMLGHAPDIKVDPPASRDSQRSRDQAQERENITQAYDQRSELEMQLPWLSRWVPGYGFGFMAVKPKRDRNGFLYPHLEIRNSFDCYPGWWGPDSKPEECAVIRQVDANHLARRYPRFKEKYESRSKASAGRIWWPGSQWEGPTQGSVSLVEYYDIRGKHLVNEETGLILDFVPNPIKAVNFVVPRRFDFDALQGQWDHVVGLMALMAKLNILGYVAAEDSVFRETNIIGDMTQAAYRRGRFAVNHFPPGVSVEKAQNDVNLAQTFSQIDRIERQLRIQANYSVMQDSQSPTSFTTGQGLDRLAGAGDENIREYQKAFRYALQELDAIRLEWDEVLYGGERKPLEVNVRGHAVAATYDPADIKGNYKTRRVYGVMAGFDDASKIVTGLQLLQGRIIDRRTFQENLYGLENLSQINDRIIGDEAMATLMGMLSERGAQGDPAATMAIAEIAAKPSDAQKILARIFTPEEPQMSPEEQAMVAAGGGAMGGMGGGPAPDIATVLSRLDMTGQAEGGVQTVGRLQ